MLLRRLVLLLFMLNFLGSCIEAAGTRQSISGSGVSGGGEAGSGNNIMEEEDEDDDDDTEETVKVELRHLVEPKVDDRRVDGASKRVIDDQDWEALASLRRSHWSEWSKFAKQRGLSPIWESPHIESCPWAMPAYAPSFFERNRSI